MKLKKTTPTKNPTMIGKIFLNYLKFVAKTGKVEVQGAEKISPNCVFGYWHGDSVSMQLVLMKLARGFKNVKVIVTADTRGDVIEHIIESFGATTLRLPDGLKIKPFFKELKEESRSGGSILATALDGPVGPLHEPKKLLFLLASEAEKELLYIRFSYKRILRINRRWDKYVIPLPFCSIKGEIETLGRVEKVHLREFEEYKKKLLY